MRRSRIKPSTKPKQIEERRLDALFQRACLIRDDNKCQAPGCVRYASAVHHLILRRYKAVRHYMPNGVSLCKHHHIEIHEGEDKVRLRLTLIRHVICDTILAGKFSEMEANAYMSIHMGGTEHLEKYIQENG